MFPVVSCFPQNTGSLTDNVYWWERPTPKTELEPLLNWAVEGTQPLIALSLVNWFLAPNTARQVLSCLI